jgi:hypothetical protein
MIFHCLVTRVGKNEPNHVKSRNKVPVSIHQIHYHSGFHSHFVDLELNKVIMSVNVHIRKEN